MRFDAGYEAANFFYINGQRVNILAFAGRMALLQLLNFAVTE